MSIILPSSISSLYSSTAGSLTTSTAGSPTSSLGSTVAVTSQQENQRMFTIDPRVVRSRLEGGQVVTKKLSPTEQKMPVKVESTKQ